MICTAAGCERKVLARGLCRLHYHRARRAGLPKVYRDSGPWTMGELLTRTKLDRNGCMVWQGARHSAGYGQVHKDGKTTYLHRLVWELASGRSVPPGMEICHHCDNPACINPWHLFMGTKFDNMRDAARKGRLANRGRR